MPTINTNDPNNVLEYIQAMRKCIRALSSICLKNGRIDDYGEVPYDEENQLYTIDISFNEGDDRELRIKIDLNPDPE